MTITLVLAAIFATLTGAFVYRFTPQFEILAWLSVGFLIIQGIDAFHDWSTYRDASKKTTQVASLCFLVGITFFGVQESYNQFLNRPRTIDRIAEWRMTRELSKYRGTIFQIVGSGLLDYDDACDLKYQLENILVSAGWVREDGECNRFPTDFGSAEVIEYDRYTPGAAIDLSHWLAQYKWGGFIAERSSDGGPIPTTMGRIKTTENFPVVVFIQIYDKRRY